jgi:putative phosphoribosyl transferase
MPLYSDRAAAGEAVASALRELVGQRDAVVLGLPRGGVPVARVVADALGAPLDVVVARKLGVPGMEEVALGAIAEGQRDIVEDSVRWYLGVPPRVVARIVERERREIERRARLYRQGAGLPDVRGRTVILVDDGLASGATLRAAALTVRRRKPARIIAAVPVASLAHCEDVRPTVDGLVAVATPDPFETVSAWYDDFAAVGDAEVLRLLGRMPDAFANATDTVRDWMDEQAVAIPIAPGERDTGWMTGDVGVPNDTPRGLVIVAHGGGSSRNSYRNRYLAGRLRQAGWATMRIDLLLDHEREADAIDGEMRFDISRIAARLCSAMEWATHERTPGAERLVLFGASTGAAAALVAAAARPDLVAGVASRGGRVDLAGAALLAVRAPVLMIVGGADADTLRRTREAATMLGTSQRLTVIPGAGHTFEEPGALGPVGEHVVDWLEALRRR